MKKGIVILFAAALGLAACNNYKKGPGGLSYIIHKDGGGTKIKEGDIVKLNFIQKSEKDSVMFNTWDMEQPQVFPVAKKVYAGDMNDVLTLFGEGDSATFKLDLDTMAARSGQPKPQGTKDKYIVFTVKVEKVLAKAAGEADSTFQKKAREFFEKDYKASIDKKKGAEAGKIKKYIADNNLKTTTTASGLQYVISKPGDAVKPALGDTMMVNYTGKLTTKKSDGKDNIFDTSDEKVAKEAGKFHAMAQYGPRPITLGRAIPGFDEGLQLIGKGGKITLIIPSNLAYGEGGMPQGGISPFSPLVFEVELTDIKKPVAAPATVPGATVTPVTPAPTVKK
ncbi:FKBP-type peptidyl-prolyl cis-trans isomerase FkpA [Pedobacter africanus]|uniref:FKBP-type peptidyl-prolyl cis-trans isomerase n=1 Tax=Pedobacter africanus TaxID=151894 RepID=A0ACC6KYC6_9SPHI|nr:FKBP-type peptidyl-prolyl cis-trans isomerase [Pedobacter africanus]MDR6784190.1 FKBP-type peptidyl-prolyl cis-trans isomerase [Pedobacter africanus]